MGARWTEQDFAVLREMAAARASTVEIARALGRTPATVSQYRGRHAKFAPTNCAFCNARLPEHVRGRPKGYCNTECSWRRYAADLINAARDRQSPVCEHCLAPMQRSSLRKYYCSVRCVKRAWYERARQPSVVR